MFCFSLVIVLCILFEICSEFVFGDWLIVIVMVGLLLSSECSLYLDVLSWICVMLCRCVMLLFGVVFMMMLLNLFFVCRWLCVFIDSCSGVLGSDGDVLIMLVVICMFCLWIVCMMFLVDSLCCVIFCGLSYMCIV